MGFGLFIPLLIPFLIVAFIMFDRVIRYEYENHKNNWEKDGKSFGFFWIPLENRKRFIFFPSFKSSWARNRLAFYWLFITPDWVKENKKIYKDLKILRFCVLVWNISILIAVFFLNIK